MESSLGIEFFRRDISARYAIVPGKQMQIAMYFSLNILRNLQLYQSFVYPLACNEYNSLASLSSSD